MLPKNDMRVTLPVQDFLLHFQQAIERSEGMKINWKKVRSAGQEGKAKAKPFELSIYLSIYLRVSTNQLPASYDEELSSKPQKAGFKAFFSRRTKKRFSFDEQLMISKYERG